MGRKKGSNWLVDFNGFSDHLAAGSKKDSNSAGKGKPTFDIYVAVTACLEQLEHTRELIGGFGLEEMKALSAGKFSNWVNSLVDSLLRSEAITYEFLFKNNLQLDWTKKQTPKPLYV